jgi:Caspase domain/VHL beta domain
MRRHEFIGLAIAVFFVVMRVSPVLAQQMDCNVEHSLTAVAGAAPVKLSFRNNSAQPRRLYWIDYQGQRKFYGTVAPGKDREQQSSAGNHWVVTDESDKCLAIFAASMTATNFDIGLSGANPTATVARIEDAKPARPAPSAVRPAGHRVALVIGNSAYKFANPLPNPANDSTDFAQALRDIGFTVIEGHDLDWRSMIAKTREFSAQLDKAELALVFYAGHGVQVDGRNYLVPVDAKLEHAGDLDLDAVDLQTMLRPMEAERRVNLVFLDACRDNPFTRSLARSLGSTRSTAVAQGLAQVNSAAGTMIAFSTQPDNVAQDGQGRNSPFTAALLKYVKTPNLEVEQMMKQVRVEVMAATQEKQVPWGHSSLVGDVYLNPRTN